MIEKIKEFFKKIFGNNNQNYLEAPTDDILQDEKKYTNYNSENNFQNEIKIESNSNEERALKLQIDFKDGAINEEDLSEEDFDILSNLYEKQIQDVKKSIENYKKKILNIQNRLESSNFAKN